MPDENFTNKPASNKEESELLLLKKALGRERVAREKAEELLDERANTLFQINQKLLQQYESITKKSSAVEFLHAVAELAQDQLNVESILRSFIELVCRLSQWPVGHVYLPEIHKEVTQLRSSKIWHLSSEEKFLDFKKITEDYIFKISEGLPGRVLHEKNSHWIKDISQDQNFPRQTQLVNLNVKSAFAIPVIVNSEIIAVTEFFAEKITEIDESLMATVTAGAKQLGTFLERHETQKQLRENFEALKQTQLQLVQSEKMASLGTIAAGVAHEINNPISFILTNTEMLATYSQSIKKVLSAYQELDHCLLEKRAKDLPALIATINRIKEEEDIEYITHDCDLIAKETLTGILRIKDIVQGLKTFSRVDEAERKEADINECIEVTLKVIWNELKYKCSLEKSLVDLPKITCYPGQLVQVFTNLLLNASQAIEERGTIAIHTSIDSDYVCITFSDTGKGIDPKNVKNIFNPFFTTKPVGQGTGLGLSISYGIIQKHGGSIDVESTVGKGTKFIIKLPIKDQSSHTDQKAIA